MYQENYTSGTDVFGYGKLCNTWQLEGFVKEVANLPLPAGTSVHFLEYNIISAVHAGRDTWHHWFDNGHALAVDVNLMGTSEWNEFVWLRDYVYPVAKKWGLAVTCPVNTPDGRGVPRHSIGDGLHLHADVGEWSNIGQGAQRYSWNRRLSSKPSSGGGDNTSPHKGVRKGDTGGAVKRVQRIVGVEADGVFGDDTARAVRDWKRVHGMSQNAVWGTSCNTMYRRLKRINVRNGSTGSDVKHVQAIVNVEEDGVFGDATEAAVKKWQRGHRLDDDGVWGPKSETAWVTIRARNKLPHGGFKLGANQWYGEDDGTSRSHSGAREEDQNEIRQIQRLVYEEEDGHFGPATTKAVRRYQSARSLATDGKVGNRTWSRMVRHANRIV